MRNYRLTLILSPLLQEQEVNDTIQQTASLIQGHGGILGDQGMKGKKPLLSPIKGHKEGYLAILEFTLNAEHTAELESASKENPHILRFLLIQKEHKKAPKVQTVPALAQTTEGLPAEKAQLKEKDLAEESLIHQPANESPEKLKEEEKIDLQGIDEKLEEIFKETQ
jgi:ribosomal protein S6